MLDVCFGDETLLPRQDESEMTTSLESISVVI